MDFDVTVLPHRSSLMRSALAFTGSMADAEDLVQETLIKAYRAFDRLRPGSDVRPWLATILRNTFISEWRRARRERVSLDPSSCLDRAPWLAPEDPASIPGHDSRGGLGDEVAQALDEVPTRYRALVVLVDLEERSYQEAATITHQPLGTVQSRLFRGRRLLRSKLEGYARREGFLARAA
jgi:RNA polymerase sigma-70 factor (ECF subfamily)